MEDEIARKRREAVNARGRAWKQRNKDKVREASKRYYAQNKVDVLARSRRYEQANRDKVNKRQAVWKLKRILASMGMSLEDYQKVISNQRNLCAICKSPPREGRRLHIDHCHVTNSFRGLLCDRCNWAMGKFQDNPDLLLKARMYLIVGGANIRFKLERAA